jgi:hypothetical protein
MGIHNHELTAIAWDRMENEGCSLLLPSGCQVLVYQNGGEDCCVKLMTLPCLDGSTKHKLQNMYRLLCNFCEVEVQHFEVYSSFLRCSVAIALLQYHGRWRRTLVVRGS